MVAINVALGFGADTQATTGLIAIRPVEEHPVIKDGRTFLALAAYESKSLSVEPIELNVTPGQLYQVRHIVPAGPTRVFEAPTETTNYADLTWLDPIPGSGGYVVQPATWVLLSTEELPDEAIPGQTYYEPDTDNFGTVGA